MASSKPQRQPCTGATYTIIATTHGYGSLSNIDNLPRQLTAQHLRFYPQTPRQDVTVMYRGYRNDEVSTGSAEGTSSSPCLRFARTPSLPRFILLLILHHSARLLKVIIEIRRGAWSPASKRELIERVYALLVQWKGKKADRTDIVVQVNEIQDRNCVMRNGSWGMWEGAVPASIESEGGGKLDDGRSLVDSERTLVGEG